MNNINDKYIFWSSDPTILYKNDKYLEFYPTQTMTRVEQLNAITRACIYFIILAFFFDKSEFLINLGIIIIIFVFIFYIIFKNDKNGCKTKY